MPIEIDVISDVVCPWCFIGKRRLEQALHRLDTGHEVSVAWRAFQLNPWLPAEGIARQDYVQRKFGAAAHDVYSRVAAVGQEVGIAFAFDRIARQPNTVAAHSLIRLAGRAGCQDGVVEALFCGYFLEGADLTRADVLVSLAQRGGLAADVAQRGLADERERDAVRAEEEAMRGLGVEGVPLFVFNRRLAVSGAQPPEVLLRAIEQAAREKAGTDAT